MGRPRGTTDCTPEKIKEICKHLERGSPIEDACALSDIAETTYYDWMRRAEAGEQPFTCFSQEARKARAKVRQFYLDVISGASCDPKGFNYKPAAWFLARSDRKNFGSEVKVDQTTTVVDANALLQEFEKDHKDTTEDHADEL